MLYCSSHHSIPAWQAPARIAWQVAVAWLCCAAPVAAASPEELLRRIAAHVPSSAAAFAEELGSDLQSIADELESSAAEIGALGDARPQVIPATIDRLLRLKSGVDRLLDAALAERGEFASLAPPERQRQALRGFLNAASQLIDLSGRLRYLLYDAVGQAASELATQPALRERLLDVLVSHRATVGADVMVDLLTDPPADSATAGRPPSDSLRSKVLRLIALAKHAELAPELATFVTRQDMSPALVIQAAETFRAVGLPQEPRPGQDRNLPAAPITARRLRAQLLSLELAPADSDLRTRREALLAWLEPLHKTGLPDDRYTVGSCEVQPGDWLLMRNPSPYNLFTDLSPGLFTHVGIITSEVGADGTRRMVVVDLPERGQHMPATNVDVFVQRTRHFVVLRHPDAAVARKIAQAAREVIGNPTQFDLNFRTDRVLELAGKPLAGQRIHTYCAGLLLLSTLSTGVAREEFFPIDERPAGGHAVANMRQLGLTLGERFISPTGAFFSPRLAIVGRREPMYEPHRQIEETIYDHFARQLVERRLMPSPDLFQSLRLKVAEASRENPLLARAFAGAAGVSAEMDLVAAAKAAAVVETLDQIAYGASGDFARALAAVKQGADVASAGGNASAAARAEIRSLRREHARLVARWERDQVSPRQVRIELVAHYMEQGRRELDKRFFSEPAVEKAGQAPRD